MPFVALTRLRVRSTRYLPQFLWFAGRAWVQARRARGSLGVRLLRDTATVFWTASLWRDEACMRAFMLRGPHAKAMPRLRVWCDEASVAHWSQEEALLPDWQQAHRRMIEVGRRSRVDHPSPAHIAFEIPQPRR
jgi:heme-degrading monooxygenase HmoA